MAARLVAIAKLAEQHQPCSVRHLFYRSVVAGIPMIGKNDAGYAKVQRAVLQLRREGRIPYSWITDNSRIAYSLDTWNGVEEFLDDMAGLYRRDLWSASPCRVEVWCESDSIASTLTDIARRWRVALFPMRGQSSDTFVYNAVRQWIAEPYRQVVVLHVGDHDPAGIEIERALRDKMLTFAKVLHHRPNFLRLAVTWAQVLEYDLPGTKPKKFYGYPTSVEAEALPPRVLREMVDEAISTYVDEHALRTLLAIEAAEREGLYALIGAPR